MKEFSATELANKTGDVLAAAAQTPVCIARHGKARFVMMSIDQFDRISGKGEPRKSIEINSLSIDETDNLIAALEHSLDHE